MPSNDLFFSEIIEGSSNNKAIEIYNGTGAAIDLSAGGYSIQMFFNGSATAGLTINLTGVIQAGDVFVLAQGSANATILAQADQTSSASWFNGDDAITLRHGATLIDAFGQVGFDPGTEWGTGLTSTADNTLRRNPTITDGDTNATDVFTPSTQWTGFATDTFDGLGSHNVSGGAATVSIGNVTISEGDAGTKVMTFTVARTDASGAFTVHYGTADGSATTAGGDYVASSGTLTFTAGGPNSQQVSVTINGDTTPEPNETFTVTLSDLQNTTGTANLGTAVATGTIANDDVQSLRIYDIQGAGHVSAYDDQQVKTEGVVTAVDTNGFWMQDETGDGNDATSDGIFVFTNAVAPGVTVGEKVQVVGTVDEFRGSAPTNLPITEITAPTITHIGTGTIAATIIGEGGRHVPTDVIDNDNHTVFDPGQDGMDFYESLEGMLVTIHDAQAVDVTSGGGTFIIPDGGAGTTGENARGGITVSGTDLNPERLQLFVDSGVTPGLSTSFDLGDHVGNVTGVISYFGGNYEVVATSVQNTTDSQSPADDVSTLVGDATHLTIAEYNLENIDPLDPQAKFDALAADITNNLHGPDIIGVEEIQDADGPGNGANLSGAATAAKLIAAIDAAGGPHYTYVEVAPATAGTSGGENGGNIRNGFLYNADRVQYVEGSARLVDPTNSAYTNTRKPLAADFNFRGETITTIDLHSTSRLGSDPGLFGDRQPPFNEGEAQRIAQSQGVHDFVTNLLASHPGQHVAVMGDFNGFQFEQSLTLLEQGGQLTNLTYKLDPSERYSYVFEGNSQQIDHILVTPELYANGEFDTVHLNSGVAGFRPTDHDPTLSRFLVNTGPTAANDAGAVSEDGSVIIDVLANDTDPNSGETKTIVSVGATAKGAAVSIVDGKVVYTADADSFDLLSSGQSANDSFSYVMKDAAGATSTATVQVTVNGVADGATQTGGATADTLNGTALDEKLDGAAGNDVLNGLGGTDTLVGGAGNDALDGGAGLDSLSAGDGADTLTGGAGDDVLTGARGSDLFVFGAGFGHDVITDFKSVEDDIRFVGAGFVSFNDMLTHANQVGANVLITNAAGDSLQLNNIQLGSLQSADFLFA